MHIPLLQGRDISANDTADSAPVVVISQSMAKQFWPNESPIGHHLKLSFFPDKDREIVGVVGDVKQHGLDSSAGHRYTLLASRAGHGLRYGSLALTTLFSSPSARRLRPKLSPPR